MTGDHSISSPKYLLATVYIAQRIVLVFTVRFLHPNWQLSCIQYLVWYDKVGVSATLLTELGDC